MIVPVARLPRDKKPRVDNDRRIVLGDSEGDRQDVGRKRKKVYVHSQFASLGSKISSTSIERLP